MKIAMYIRVSTHHQIDKDSLPLQRQDLINYSSFVLNCNNYEIFEDAGYSAKNTERPKYKEMMSRIRKNEFTHLLVWKIDRISRNLLDFCDMYNELKEHKCIFISRNEQFDTSSAMGEAMLKIILVFAELERKLTGERVKAIMFDRASKGKWNGAPIPLGYRWNNDLKYPEIDDEEAKTVNAIFNKYLETKSTSAVKEYLNTNGIKTKRNGSWTTKTIADILRNVFYIGTYRYNYRERPHGKIKDESEWIVVEDNHAGIVSKELFKKCNDILDINAARNSAMYRANSKTHVFAGLIQCGECGHNFNAKQDKARSDGFRPSMYFCKGRYDHLGCSQKTISEDYIATLCFNVVKNIISISSTLKKISIEEFEQTLIKNTNAVGVSNIETLYKHYLGFSDENYTVNDNCINTIDTSVLESKKSKLERALRRLDDLYLFDDETMSEKDYILKKNDIKKELERVNKELNSIVASSENKSELINKVLLIGLEEHIKIGINYRKMIDEIGREMLKKFTNNLFSKIIVKDKKVISITLKNNLNISLVYPE